MLRIESKNLKVMPQPAHKVLLAVQKAISSALLGQPLLSSLSCCLLLCYLFLQFTEIVRILSVQNLCSITLMTLTIPNLFVPLHMAGSHGS